MDEIRKTIELAEELKPMLEWASFNIFTGYPTSPLYEYVKENTLYEKEVSHGILIVKSDELDRARLEEIRTYAHKRINRSKQWKRLSRLAFSEIKQGTLSPRKIVRGVKHLITGQ